MGRFDRIVAGTRGLRAAALALVVLTAADRPVDVPPAVANLYVEGRWQAAIDAATGLDSADGYGLAARATLVRAGYEHDTRAAQRSGLAQALALARQALSRDPDHAEGNLQAAAALGYRARFDSSIGDARAARRHIDRALDAHPDNAWAQAADGAWHGEVVLGAGPVIARVFFGASRAKARVAFKRAQALAPDTIAVLFNEAQIRLRFGKPDDVAAAQALFSRIADLPPANAFDALLQHHAAQVMALTDAGADAMIDGLERFLPFRAEPA